MTGSIAAAAGTKRLPRLLQGPRRGLFAGLVGVGVAQAALAVQAVLLVPMVLNPDGPGQRLLALTGVVLGALLLGLLRAAERVLAEQLGQHYVHQLRIGLAAAALRGSATSLGTVVVRSSNDLTAVRNWIAQGIAPITAAVPLTVGSLAALASLHPVLAVGVAVPLCGLVAWLLALAPAMYLRSRELRRVRGRLAAHLADAVAAAPAIRAGGGLRREGARIARRGSRVRQSAVARARIAGAMRGGSMAAGGLATAGVLAVAGPAGVPLGEVATAVTVVGILAGPLADIGRVAEYRQSYRAARRILVGALNGPDRTPGRSGAPSQPPAVRPSEADGPRITDRAVRDFAVRDPAVPDSAVPDSAVRGFPVRDSPVRGLVIRGLVVDGVPVPDLDAQPGDRIVLCGPPERRRAVLEVLLGESPDAAADGHRVGLDGRDLELLPADERRRLVGAAVHGWPLQRGTLRRAIGYRVPDTDDTTLTRSISAAALDPVLTRLPRGLQTRLRHGGAPLTPSERAQVLLARALLGDPRLVVLDKVPDAVDEAARPQIRTGLAQLSGIVIADVSSPGEHFARWRQWLLQPADQPSRRSAQ